mmetsp:Transcript_3816/g.17582  ORF Transcript_3816/g.17582 Transcript_3816/m.17582 type:complete len:200 (-) Transcript_3816:79-678(-)
MVEHVRDVLPHVRVAVLAQALVVEAVHLRDLPALVVASDDGDAVGVANLEGHHERDRLDRVVPAVHVVAQEEVVRVRRVSAELEHLQQVVKLSVDVPHDRHGRPHAVHVGLLADQTARALAQLQHLLLRQELVLEQRRHHGIIGAVLLDVELAHLPQPLFLSLRPKPLLSCSTAVRSEIRADAWAEWRFARFERCDGAG